MKNLFKKIVLPHKLKWLGFGGACFAALSLAIFPLTSAITLCGFVFAGAFVVYERKRRLFWENSLSYKLLDLNRRQESLMEHLNRQDMPEHSDHDSSAQIYDEIKNMTNIMRADASAPESSKTNITPPADPPIYSPAETVLTTPTNQGGAQNYADLSAQIVSPGAPPAPKRAPSILERLSPQKRANDLPEATMPAYYSPSLIAEFIHHALNKSSLKIMRQPIMQLPERKARLYMLSAQVEAYTGTFMRESEYMEVAQAKGLDHSIMALILKHAINAIRHGSMLTYALKIRSKTLSNAPFMRMLFDFLRESPEHARHIVLELTHHDFENMQTQSLQVIRSLTRMRAQFMISEVDRLDIDSELLQKLNIRMVKIPASAISDKMLNADGFRQALDLRRSLEGLGISVVLDQINSEADMMRYEGFSPRYAQGALFAPSELRIEGRQDTQSGMSVA